MATLSPASITALAHDAASVRAGQLLAKSGAWKSLGHSERAIWGECQGSALYRTQVAVLDLATHCSCPSRKVPCKHALALMFLVLDPKQRVPASADGSEPEWVASWLARRGLAQQKQGDASKAQDAKPVDREAQEKRAAKRHANVLAGIDQLDIWMADLVRQGLARLTSESPDFWDEQARRLVDAQAPGLAGRIRSLGARVGVGENWGERVLAGLGRLAWLTHAYRRIDALPRELQYDVRRLVGYTLDRNDVLAHADFVSDEWLVVSASIVEDERFRTQRSWLVGVTSGRRAFVLETAAGNARFLEVFVAGSAFRGKLAFWPGNRPERALIAERSSAPELGRAPSTGRSIKAALDDFASELAREPWLTRTLLLLDAVRIVRGVKAGVEEGRSFYAIDADGQALTLYGADHDVLWALSGGHPLLLAAEWDGFALEPLTAFVDGRCVPLRDYSEEAGS